MAKEKKQKPILKKNFTHYTQIPKSIRDRKINDLDLANEWNQNLQKGRENGVMEESYPWIIWFIKYFWSIAEGKWVSRDPSKAFYRENQRLALEEIFLVLSLLVTRRNKCGSDFIQTLIDMLKKIKINAIEMESTIEVKEIVKGEENGQTKEEKGSESEGIYPEGGNSVSVTPRRDQDKDGDK